MDTKMVVVGIFIVVGSQLIYNPPDTFLMCLGLTIMFTAALLGVKKNGKKV